MSEISRSSSRVPAHTTHAAHGPAQAAPAAAAEAAHEAAAVSGDVVERRRDGSAPTVAPKASAAPAAAGVNVKRGLSSSKPYDPNADVAKLFTAMKGGMTGLGTDEAAIADVLRNKTPDQVKALRAAYADRYPGRSLDGDIKDELSGSDLKAALRVLNAKTASVPTVSVKEPAALVQTLAAASPTERAAIAADHHKRTGKSLNADIARHLDGDVAVRARALLSNNDALDQAAQLHAAMKGLGTDEQAIDDVLSKASPEARRAIEASFAKEYGTPLRSELRKELSGTDLDLATAHLDNDTGAATATRLQQALSGVGTDHGALERAYAGTSVADRERAAAVFAQKTGTSLDAAFARDMSGRDLDDARSLAKNGALSDVQRLDRAMRNSGTDEGELKSVLEGKTKAEVDALSTAYQARTGRALHDDVRRELGGRDRFVVEMLLRGTPDLSTDAGLKDAVARAVEARQFERSGLGNVVGNAITALGGNGKVLDESTARLEQALSAATQPDGSLSATGAARLRTLLDYQRGDVSAFRDARDSAAQAAGTTAAVVAGVAVTVATAGAAAPLVIAAGTAAGAAAKGVVGVAVRGSATEDATWSDVRKGAVDGLAGAVGGVASRGVANVVSRTMSVGEGVAARAGVRVAAQTEGVIERGFVGKTVEQVLTGGVKGTLGGGTTGAASSIVDPNTYKGDLASALSAVATQTARGAFAGAASGLNPANAVAGNAVGKIAPHVQKASDALLSKAGLDVRTQVQRLAENNGVLQQTTAKLVQDTPKGIATAAAASSLQALFTGRPEDMLSAAAKAALDKTEGTAKDAAVNVAKETALRTFRRT
jgi:hypothetical protein